MASFRLRRFHNCCRQCACLRCPRFPSFDRTSHAFRAKGDIIIRYAFNVSQRLTPKLRRTENRSQPLFSVVTVSAPFCGRSMRGAVAPTGCSWETSVDLIVCLLTPFDSGTQVKFLRRISYGAAIQTPSRATETSCRSRNRTARIAQCCDSLNSQWRYRRTR
jgi:hypothetical protein